MYACPTGQSRPQGQPRFEERETGPSFWWEERKMGWLLCSRARCPLLERTVHSLCKPLEWFEHPLSLVFSVTAASVSVVGKRLCGRSENTWRSFDLTHLLATQDMSGSGCEDPDTPPGLMSMWSLVLIPWGGKKGLSETLGLRARTQRRSAILGGRGQDRGTWLSSPCSFRPRDPGSVTSCLWPEF